MTEPWEKDLADFQAIMDQPAEAREKRSNEIIAKYPEHVTRGEIVALNTELNDRYMYLLLRHKQRLVGLEKKIDELTSQLALALARLHDVEARGAMEYLGVWDPDKTYQRGNFVTLNGAMWHCEMKTTSRPASDGTWKLAVKSAPRP